MEHRKLDALMTPIERIARVAAAGLTSATSSVTKPSGAKSYDNADGTRTIIGNVANGESNPSYTMATHVGDTTAPGTPTGITVSSKSGVVVVEWDGTLTGGIPDDFYCVRVYLDGSELGILTGAGSVSSASLEGGTTHSITATAEDDACLPDGTPAHNVSAATTAISVTVSEDVESVAAEVEQVRQDVADFRDDVATTYATKVEREDGDDAVKTWVTTNYTNSNDLATTYATKTLVSQTKDAIELAASQTYETQSDAAATYATKSALTVGLDGIRSEVAEDYQPKGDYATTASMNSAIQQSASSIESSVAATYETKSDAAATYSTKTEISDAKTYVANAKANYGYQYKKDIVVYGESSKYYPVYFTNVDAIPQTVTHEIMIRREYNEQAPSDWNTSTHKGGLNIHFGWNFGSWGGATYKCEVYEFTQMYSTMVGDVLVGADSGMFSIVYLRGGGTTGALYHVYSDVPFTRHSYMANAGVVGENDVPYIGLEQGVKYAQSVTGDNPTYKWNVRAPLTEPNTTHLNELYTVNRTALIESRVSTAETTIAQNNTQIALKANSSDVYTKSAVDGKITQEVSDRNAAITAKANEINLSVAEKVYQGAQPNLSPYFSSTPYNTTNTYWKSIQTGNGYTFTNMGDGWMRVQCTNSGSSVIRRDWYPIKCPSVIAGQPYTWLVEIRNNASSSISSGSNFYLVQSANAQFWGQKAIKTLNDAQAGIDTGTSVSVNLGVLAESGVMRKVQNAETASDGHWTDGNPANVTGLACWTFRCGAGATIDYEVRLSVYEGEYTGPYKPYSGTQLYASQAELKVTNDSISTKVDKDGVISSINQSAESVTIDAGKINLVGAVTIGDLASATQDAVLNSNYIVADSSGIKIADSNPASSTTYQHQTSSGTDFVVNGGVRNRVNADGMTLYDGNGTADGNIVASLLNSGIRLGNSNSCHVDIGSNELLITPSSNTASPVIIGSSASDAGKTTVEADYVRGEESLTTAGLIAGNSLNIGGTQTITGVRFGFSSATTNSNGITTFNPNLGVQPTAVFVAAGKASGETEAVAKIAVPMVWSVDSATQVQVRWQRSDTNAWLTNNAVGWYWLALA